MKRLWLLIVIGILFIIPSEVRAEEYNLISTFPEVAEGQLGYLNYAPNVLNLYAR